MDHKEQLVMLKNQALVVNAPAKINLSLLIKGKRPDGFHELETLMTKINWYDQLHIRKSPRKGINLKCRGKYWAPEGEENLVYQACKLFCNRFKVEPAFDIELHKNIPAGTGLGSASSDAAATLIGLKKIMNIDADKSILKVLAAQLGSDIAFFLGGPAAFCTGRGEKVRDFPKKLNFFALLVLPDQTVSTKTVYSGYNHDEAVYADLKEKTDALVKQNKIFELTEICPNMLADSCYDQFPEVLSAKKKVEQLGVERLCLSGSGSAMFTLSKNMENAQKWHEKVNGLMGCESVIVRSNRW